ncbi:MAG: hypothetical protein AAGA77_12215 [Bacteroidota bacterium]
MPGKNYKLEEKLDRLENNSYYRIFKLILPILAVGGLVFAVYDNYQSNQQSENILERISTKYIGNFPTQIPEITNRINSCSKKLVIATDHPAYGCFSSPDEFEAYKLAIFSKLSKSISPGFESLTLIVYDKERRRKELIKQFDLDPSKLSDTLYFNDYLKGNKLKAEWKEKLEAFKTTENAIKEIKTWNDLFREIEKLNEEISKKVQNSQRGEVCNINIDDEPLPVYYWLFESNDYALVSFRSYGKLTKEATISTSHPPMIEYVNGMSNDIKNSKTKN